MKANLFNFRHSPNEFQTPTTRALNGGRTGVDTTVRGRWKKALPLLLFFLGLQGFSTQAWANDGGWNGDKAVSVGHTENGGTRAYYDYSNSDMGTYKLGTISSSFVINDLYLKVWDDWGLSTYKITGGQLCYWVYTNSSAKGDTHYIQTNNKTSKNKNNFELQNTSCNKTIASSTDPSGKYTFEHYFQAWGNEMSDIYWNGNGNNYKWTYTILPPAVSNFNVGVTGSIVAGTGTSSDPYIVLYNTSLTLTVSGSQEHTDANSSFQVQFGTGEYSSTTTTTTSAIKSASKASITVNAKFNNSSASLDGAVSTQTIYYKTESYTLTLNDNGGTGGSTSSKVFLNSGSISFTSPTRTGYKFGGYYSADQEQITVASGTLKANTAYTNENGKWNVRNGATLYAGWSASKYNVTLNQTDATTPASRTNPEVTFDAALPTLNAANVPSRTNYDFAGYWTQDGTNGEWGSMLISSAPAWQEVSGFTETVSSTLVWKKADNATVHPKWTPTTYSITYKDQDNKTFTGTWGDGAVHPTSYNIETAAFTISNPSKVGYTFSGWYSDATCTVAATTTIILGSYGDKTFYAKWTPKTTTLILHQKAGDVAEIRRVTATYDATFDESQLTPTLPGDTMRTGYDFVRFLTTAEAGGGKRMVIIQPYNGALVHGNNQENFTSGRKWASELTELDIYGDWTARTYTITLNDNGGSGGSDTKTATFDSYSNITSVTKPTRTDYTFAGYYDDQAGEGVQVYDANGAIVASAGDYTDSGKKWKYPNNVTLYAKWNSAGNYVVTLNNQSADYAGTTEVAVKKNTTQGLTSAIDRPTKTGYTFGGYFTGATGAGTQIINGNGEWIIPTAGYINETGKWIYDGNQTFKAYWIANQTTITFNRQGGASGTGQRTIAYNSTDFGDALVMPTRNGYTFGGYWTGENGTGVQLISDAGAWLTNATGFIQDGKWIKTTTDPMTIYAKWTEKMTTVTLSAGTGGSVNPSAQQSVGVTTTASIEAIPATGYTFNAATGWAVDGNAVKTDANPTTLSGNGDAGTGTLTATFTETMHTVYIEGGTEGSASAGIATTGTATAATAATGKHFVNWTIPQSNFELVNCQITNQTITFRATADGTVTANYADTDYPVSIIAGAGGSITSPVAVSASSSANYDAHYHEPFQLVAEPATGYSFGGWTASPDNAFSFEFANASGGSVQARKIAIDNSSEHADGTWATLIVANNDAKSLTASFEEILHEVTIVNGTPASVEAGVATAPTITAAAAPIGQGFDKWVLSDGVTLASGELTDPSVTIHASKAGTAEATYKDVPTVYFKNTLGWGADEIWVTLDSYWDSSSDNIGAGSNEKTEANGKYINMKRIGETDYYYATISIDAGSFTNIAFNKGKQENYDNFHDTKACYRSDWNVCQPLFVPSTTKSSTNNGTDYYNSGSWDTYSTTSKYYLSGEGDTFGKWGKVESLRFVKESATSDIQSVSVTLAASTTYSFKVRTCADSWYGVDASTTITSSNYTNIQFGSDKSNNCSLVSTEAGIYTFTFDNSTKKLSVTYPAEQEFKVNIVSGGNGTVDPEGEQDVPQYTGLAISASPATGYYFVNWTPSDANITFTDASKASTKVMASAAGTATANFAPAWTLRGTMNSWSGSANPFINFSENVGTTTVVSLAKGNYQFLIYEHGNDTPWGHDVAVTRSNCTNLDMPAKTSGNNCTITADVTGDYIFSFDISTKKLTVTYPTAYVVTFSTTEGASGSVMATVDGNAISSGDRVLAGKNVTFTAPEAATSYHFVCWKDGNDTQLSTDNPYTVSNISADVTVKAVYGGTTHKVTISSDAQGTVSPSGEQDVDNIAGLQITATATTDGYVFDRWVLDGNVSLTGALTANPNTVKATGTGTVTATYKQAQVVYFKNTLGWENVYIYIFNQANVFDGTKGVCPSHTSRVAFSQMALAQGEIDVYVYTYNGALETMKSIAFCKQDQSTKENFYQTEACYRSDYSAANPMFVPQTTSNETKNETKYFSAGTWFPFNTNKNYYIQFDGEVTTYPLVFTTAGSLEATIADIDLTAYTTYTFSLYDNAHPVDAQPVAYGREEAITYAKDNEFVSLTNSAVIPATLMTITGGTHTFSANFNSDVRPQVKIDFPTAYTLDYGVAPGGQSATAVRTGTTDTIAPGAYVAPGQSVTLTQTASAGCNFHSWNTKADGTGTNLSSDATYTFAMPASAHTAYALYNGADVPSSFQILGTFNNWASTNYMRSKSVVGELVYDSIYLEAGREYKFKVYNSSGAKWYGNTGIMTQAHCTQWTFTEGTGNCTLATTIAGWYKFTLNKSTMSLNVTYPENEKQATMYDSPVKSKNTDVMIQAFYWAHKGNTSEEYTAFGDVKWAALNAEADTLAKYFDMVWLAPSQETADFTGYLPINYSNQGSTSATDGHSPWGTGAQLRTLIDNLHNGGSKVIADIVINHSSAGHTDEYSGSNPNWCHWSSFDFGRYGVYSPDYTWLAKGDEMFYAKKSQAGECGQLDNTDNEVDEWAYSYKGGTGYWTEGEFNCAYSRDWAHKKQEVREMSRAYLTWMRDSIGYDGWRYDFAKGFHGSHLYDYNRSTGAYFSVAEVFDGDIDKQLGVLADAGRETYMFDFPGKFNLYNYAIREYRLENLKGNYNTLIGNDANKKYAVTFIDNHDSFHEEGKSLNYKANTIDDRQAHQAICYLFSMPGVPCLVYPYWNNYKEIVKKVIYARKAAGINSESTVEGDWGACEKEDDRNNNTYYNAKIKGDNGYIFLKLGKYGVPLNCPESGYTLVWGNEQAAVWIKTDKVEESKFRLLITANGQTYYSNDVTRNGQTLSFYATPDAKYQWQKYEMFQWKDCPGTAPVASTGYVYTATFDSVNMAATDMALYDGDYYIRTDAVGWNDYKDANHKFTYFDNASVAAGDTYHYYWVKNIAKNNTKENVHATVGNEYNEHVTNTLGTDQFTDSEGKVEGDNNGINIRFSYEPTTNYLGRAMILGSTNNKYLNVVGSNIYKEKACTTLLDETHYSSTPTDSKLGDISDWVYERVVFVKITNEKPSSNVVVKSVFKTTPSSAEQTQYMLGFQRDFYGNLTDDPVQYAVLDNGTTKSETAYCIRVIYDFKTNRLVGSWEPVDQEVTDSWKIDADVMFRRTENSPTAQITFRDDNDTISSLKNVLFIMEFAKDSGITNGENFYWFSLPYDCHISSIYGVGDYVTLDNNGLPTKGTWGIQRYDGETRAKTGWFKEDTQTFWKWMDKDEVLEAGEGYVLDFDKSCATFNTIGVEEICDTCASGTKTVQKSVLRLYFPSDEPGFSMTKSGAVDSMYYADHTCNIKNRKAQDSNWRLMSPGNYSNTTIANEKDIRYDEKDSTLSHVPQFIYAYDRSKEAGSRYTAVQATDGFTYNSFTCYMAQFSGAVKWAQFTKADQVPSVAARQYADPGEIQLANMKLVMENSYGETQDHTYIKLKKGATTGYDANSDLTKIVNSGFGQIYSVSESVDYAANVLPVESQTVALKIVTTKAGTYTFSMPDGTDGVTATLIDTQTDSRTDLGLFNYTIDLNAGTIANRFFLDIDVKKAPTPTDITNPDELDENGNPIKTVKFIRNEQLYILRDGVVYDAQGRKQ